jgi:hypothetical protein
MQTTQPMKATPTNSHAGSPTTSGAHGRRAGLTAGTAGGTGAALAWGAGSSASSARPSSHSDSAKSTTWMSIPLLAAAAAVTSVTGRPERSNSITVTPTGGTTMKVPRSASPMR